MIYIKYFENSTAVGEGVDVDLPNVSWLVNRNVLFIRGTESTATVKYNSTTDEIEVESAPDYSTMYLTFKALESGTFSFTKNGTGNDIQYSLDGGSTWVSLTSGSNTPTVAAGNNIMWKANNLAPGMWSGIGTFSSTGRFDAYGNTMSLLYDNNFIGQTDLTGKDFAFYGLFHSNTKIVNAQNLILPATTLAYGCYGWMFYGCSNLTTAPELPATTLAELCYTLMFYYCTSLTTAPELPAITLVDWCYQEMFEGCTSLNYIKCLATNISALDSTSNWVTGVAPSGTFVKNELAGWTTTGESGVPSGWVIETAIPNIYKDWILFNYYTYTNTSCPISYYDISNYDSLEIDGVAYTPQTAVTLSAGYHLIAWKLKNGVTDLGYGFYDCAGIERAVLPSFITSIPYYGFHGTHLKTIDIPDSVTLIDGQAFDYISQLTSVTIGTGIQTINGGAFYNDTNLVSVTIKATTPPTLQNTMVFEGTTCTFYVPSGSVNAYKTASVWSNYASRIQAIS